MEQGYVAQTFQIPAALAKTLRSEFDYRKTGAVKVIGTAMAAFYAALPPEVRDEWYTFVLKKTWDGADAVEPTEVFEELMRLLKDPPRAKRSRREQS